MKLSTFLLVVMLSGCGMNVIDRPVFAAPPVHHDWIAEMKAIAKKKGYHYAIFCLSGDDSFGAYICERDCLHAGSLDNMWWMWKSGATQVEAAHNLVESIEKTGQWYPPEPKKPSPPHDSMQHKQCPPPIEGGPQ